MSRSDWLLLALNLSALLMGMVGLESQHPEPMSMGILLAAVALVANSVRVLRRAPSPPRERRPTRTSTDDLDARTILDLDARLEALEQAQADAADAARWRALVESGHVTAPAADPGLADPDARRATAVR